MVSRPAGVPYGRTRCTACGAPGVNRRTCTGDRKTHAELAKPYTPNIETGNGSGPTSYPREYDEDDTDHQATTGYDPSLNEAPPDQVDEVVDEFEDEPHPTVLPLDDPDSLLDGEVVYTPPAHNLVKTTLTFITTTPIALEAAARMGVQDQDIDHIWLDTDIEDVKV